MSRVTDLRVAVAETVAQADLVPSHLHVAEPGEEEAILGLLDESVRWMNSRGNTEQWGTEAFSQVPARAEQARGWVASGGAVLATLSDRPAGALVLGEAPAYVLPATEPEVYIVLLVSGRDDEARGTGRRLLALSDDVAVRMGRTLLRVDCYAGADGAVVRFYESAGFTAVGSFTHRETWPGQVLERRLA